ncbi:hypothetical protein [Candidatus Protochlamydia phocaeensis]|uniref:hypothetical protein n=1 Tax=Candidatus Protochlamydia phocaeensis TaxID=1414722 RepID=UPI000839218A|nr:hypothetical protein [Candidatus Protochlamydia phocaeensis]
MHVSRQDYGPVQTSSSEENNKALGTNGTGSIAGRTANPISPSVPNDSALIKSVNSTHSQLEKIPIQPLQEPKPSPIATPINITLGQQEEPGSVPIFPHTHINDLSENDATFIRNEIANPTLKNAFALASLDTNGKAVYKNMTSAAAQKLPASQFDNIYTAVQLPSGKLALLTTQEKADTLHQQKLEFHDEHGNPIEYEIVIIDKDMHDTMHASIRTLVDNFVAARLETEKAKQNEQREDVQREHARHPNPLKSFRPPAESPEKKTEKKKTDVDSLKLLLATPESIVKNVIAAERAMEAKQQEKDRVAAEKKKRIREQEENREIRHESYKKAEIQGIEKQHDTLKHEINDQERGRPAPLNPTKRRRIEP